MLISYSNQSNLTGENYDWVPILALFVFIWVNDTAAYFIGSLIGKHKLMEHISPNKSVEGFIAGILFTLLAALIFAWLYPEFQRFFGWAMVPLLPCSAHWETCLNHLSNVPVP